MTSNTEVDSRNVEQRKGGYGNFSSLYLLHLAVHVKGIFVMPAGATEAFM